MPTLMITNEELRKLRIELLNEMRILLAKQASAPHKRYLRSMEVMELLQISSSTLQNFRENGTLPYSKVGGIIYFDIEDIQQLMEAHRVRHLNL